MVNINVILCPCVREGGLRHVSTGSILGQTFAANLAACGRLALLFRPRL